MGSVSVADSTSFPVFIFLKCNYRRLELPSNLHPRIMAHLWQLSDVGVTNADWDIEVKYYGSKNLIILIGILYSLTNSNLNPKESSAYCFSSAMLFFGPLLKSVNSGLYSKS